MSTFSHTNGPDCGDGGSWLPIFNKLNDYEDRIKKLEAILTDSSKAQTVDPSSSSVYRLEAQKVIATQELISNLKTTLKEITGTGSTVLADTTVSALADKGQLSVGTTLLVNGKSTLKDDVTINGDLNVNNIFASARLEFDTPRVCSITCNHYYVLAQLQKPAVTGTTGYYRPGIVFLHSKGTRQISALVMWTAKDVFVLYDKDKEIVDLAFGVANFPSGAYLYCYARTNGVGGNPQQTPNGLYKGQVNSLPTSNTPLNTFVVGDWVQLLPSHDIYVVNAINSDKSIAWQPYGTAYMSGVDLYASYINCEEVTSAVAISPSDLVNEVHCTNLSGIAFTFLDIANASIGQATIGDLTVNNNAKIGGNLAVTGDIDADDLHLTGALIVDKATTLNGATTIGDPKSKNTPLVVNGPTTLNGDTTIKGAVTVVEVNTNLIKDSAGHAIVQVDETGDKVTLGSGNHHTEIASQDRPTVLDNGSTEQIAYLKDFASSIVYQASVKFYDTDVAHLPTGKFPVTANQAQQDPSTWTGELNSGDEALILPANATNDTGGGYYVWGGTSWALNSSVGNPVNQQIWEWDAEYVMTGTDVYWHNARILWNPTSTYYTGQKVFIVNLPLENYYDMDQINSLFPDIANDPTKGLFGWPDWLTPIADAYATNPLNGTTTPNPKWINNKPVTGMSVLDGGEFKAGANFIWDYIVEGGDYTTLDSNIAATLTNSPTVDEYANVCVKVARGDKATLPSAAAALPPPYIGAKAGNINYMLYYCMDTEELFISNGTTWKRINDPHEYHIEQVFAQLDSNDPVSTDTSRSHTLTLDMQTYHEAIDGQSGSDPDGNYEIDIKHILLKLIDLSNTKEVAGGNTQFVVDNRRITFGQITRVNDETHVQVEVHVEDKLPHRFFSNPRPTGSDARDTYVMNGLDTTLTQQPDVTQPQQLLKVDARSANLADPYVDVSNPDSYHMEETVTIESADRILQALLTTGSNPLDRTLSLSSPRVQNIEKLTPRFVSATGDQLMDITPGDKSIRMTAKSGAGYNPMTGEFGPNVRPSLKVYGQLPAFVDGGGTYSPSDIFGATIADSEYQLQIFTDAANNCTMRWIRKLLPAASISYSGSTLSKPYGSNTQVVDVSADISFDPNPNSTVWLGSNGSPGTSSSPNPQIRASYDRATGTFSVEFRDPLAWPNLIPGTYNVRFTADAPSPATGGFAQVEIPVTITPVPSTNIAFLKPGTTDPRDQVRLYVGDQYENIAVNLLPIINSDQMVELTTTGWFSLNNPVTDKDHGTIVIPSTTPAGNYAVTIAANPLAGGAATLTKTCNIEIVQLTTQFVNTSGQAYEYYYNLAAPPSTPPVWNFDRVGGPGGPANDSFPDHNDGNTEAFLVTLSGANNEHVTVTLDTDYASFGVGKWVLNLKNELETVSTTITVYVFNGTMPPNWNPAAPATSIQVSSLQNMRETVPNGWTYRMGNQPNATINVDLIGPQPGCDDIIQYDWNVHSPSLMNTVDIQVLCPTGLGQTPNLSASIRIAYRDGAGRPVAEYTDNYVEVTFLNITRGVSGTLRIYIHL